MNDYDSRKDWVPPTEWKRFEAWCATRQIMWRNEQEAAWAAWQAAKADAAAQQEPQAKDYVAVPPKNSKRYKLVELPDGPEIPLQEI